MSWRNIATVFRKELKDSLRDRRTLISMILVPMLIMPVLMIGVGKIASTVVRKAQREVPAIMILGGEDSPGVVAQLEQSRRVRVMPRRDDWRTLISEKKLRAAVQIPRGFEAGLRQGRAEPVVIYHYEGEMKSGFAREAIDGFFRELRERAIGELLERHALPPTLVRPFTIRRENVAPPEKVGGNLFGGLVPYLIIMLCFTGAMYPGMDLTAGEKERGTMETLLCSPVARSEIVAGKFLMVLTGSLAAMMMALVSLAVTAAALGKLIAGGGGVAANAGGATLPMAIDPAGIVGVIAMILPVAVLFSALILAVALFAKSYKEAQSYVTPMIVVVILPAVVGLLPGIELNARLSLVPILNLSLVCKEMLSGVWHWPYIALIFGSSCVYAAAALWIAVKLFDREDVMFRS